MPPFTWQDVVQGGAVVVLLLWVWDLRKERDALKERLNRIVDKIAPALNDRS